MPVGCMEQGEHCLQSMKETNGQNRYSSVVAEGQGASRAMTHVHPPRATVHGQGVKNTQSKAEYNKSQTKSRPGKRTIHRV
eukprot:scaffold300_cov144-Isochrysis_galbana.AAC.6